MNIGVFTPAGTRAVGYNASAQAVDLTTIMPGEPAVVVVHNTGDGLIWVDVNGAVAQAVSSVGTSFPVAAGATMSVSIGTRRTLSVIMPSGTGTAYFIVGRGL